MITEKRNQLAFGLLLLTMVVLATRDLVHQPPVPVPDRQLTIQTNKVMTLQSRVNSLYQQLGVERKANQEAALLLSRWKEKYPEQAEKFRKQDAAAGKEGP